MAPPSASKSPATAKHLIETLSGSAALPVFVRRMDPHTLNHLVKEVGLEDAGALIAHVSHNQLLHLLDETLWTGARPGEPEKLSVAELLRWLDLWNSLGRTFVAERLHELGGDFCALAFSRLLVVSDHDLAPRVFDEHTQMLGPFIVRVRVDDEWDTVQTALNALWSDHPDFAEAVFGRLAFRHSALKLFGEDDTPAVLDADAGYEHERGREQAGYVTSVMAGAFLGGVLSAEPETLAQETEYDLQTREYFRRRAQLQRQAGPSDREAPAGAEQDVPEDAADTAQSASSEQPATGLADELGSLEAVVEAFERDRFRPAALIAGPQSRSNPEAQWVRQMLTELQTDRAVFDRCMDEVTYLANLLLVGVEADGGRLESPDAAALVVDVCNLGASHELWLEAPADPLAAVRTLLEDEPGLVRLFRIGWRLLAGLPLEAADRLQGLFADPAVRQALQAKRWVLSEVDALLSSPDYRGVVTDGEFEDARETLKILGVALEPEAVVTLCALTDGVPRYALLLDGDAPEGALVTHAARNFTSMADLLAVHRFLDGLGGLVRL